MALENNKRLLMELDKHRRDVNQETINSKIENLNLEKLKPVVDMVAKSRAAYIHELLKLANNQTDTGVSLEQLEQLKIRGIEFKELIKATNALEIAIEREYIDIIANTNSS
jgi:hypothetical protein